MKSLNFEIIKNYKEIYNKDKNNKIIENAITKNGINKVCINNDVVKRNRNLFNIELPKSKIYDQKYSSRCWLHAGINLIKNNVADNLNLKEENYALSINFLCFLDKLEKSNSMYERILANEKFDLKEELNKDYLKHAVYEGGYFEYFRSLVNKYGIVPETIMPDVESSLYSEQLSRLFNEKVKKDIFCLLSLKKNNAIDKLRKEKNKMLEENYNILAKCLGDLPVKFTYEYKDKEDKYVIIKDITPKEFAEKYLTINLNDLVGISNLPMFNKEYKKLYRKKYSENIIEDCTIEFINLPVEVLKDLALHQLKDNMPVYFGCDMKKMRDNDLGIMDAELYNYKDVFNFELLSKEEALNLYDINYQHVMLITGVHVVDDKIIRWKVEDSYGDKVHKDGYYILNDNFFNDFVIQVIIDKKYLSKEQLKLFKQEPILFEMDDPF